MHACGGRRDEPVRGRPGLLAGGADGDRPHQAVQARGGRIDHVAHCPHAPDDGCDCRKPAIGLLEQIASLRDRHRRGAVRGTLAATWRPRALRASTGARAHRPRIGDRRARGRRRVLRRPRGVRGRLVGGAHVTALARLLRRLRRPDRSLGRPRCAHRLVAAVPRAFVTSSSSGRTWCSAGSAYLWHPPRVRGLERLPSNPAWSWPATSTWRRSSCSRSSCRNRRSSSASCCGFRSSAGRSACCIRSRSIGRRRGAEDADPLWSKAAEHGAWLILFPEGTRLAPGEQGKVQRGGAALATAANVPVVVVAHSAGRCWPARPVEVPGLDRHRGLTADRNRGRTTPEVTAEAQQWLDEAMARLYAEEATDAVHGGEGRRSRLNMGTGGEVRTLRRPSGAHGL